MLVLVARDLLVAGNQAFQSVGLLFAVFAATGFAVCCALLGIALLRGQKTRMLGQVMAGILAVGLALYLGVNVFMFLRLQFLVNAVASLLSIAGLWFCWVTIRAARA